MNLRRSAVRILLSLLALAMLTSQLKLQASAQAQFAPCTSTPTKGLNVVTCLSGSIVSAGASYAYVDASGWVNQVAQTDICAVISDILTSGPSGPLTIDARGVFPTTPASFICTVSAFPTGSTRASTILLPAASIQLETPWVVPSNTRIVGEGAYGGTTLRPNSSIPATTSALITLCAASGCTNSSIENINIVYPAVGTNGFSAQQSLITGIENKGAGDQSYVSNVSFSNLSGTGLLVGSNAARSGPYANIGYVANTCQNISGVTTCPVCAEVHAQTRGLHGFTCIGDVSVSGSPGHPAIAIEASNNTVEDIHIEGFWDGVQIGALPPSAGSEQRLRG